jgi:hypothetical protein
MSMELAETGDACYTDVLDPDYEPFKMIYCLTVNPRR